MRTWSILVQVITCEFCGFSQRVLQGVHSPCSRRSVVQWGGHMRRPYVYYLCILGLVSISIRAPLQSLTTDNQRRTWTRILSPSSMWRIPATESRYSFYRMSWVNPNSEHTTEMEYLPWVGFEPTTSCSTVQRVTTELSSFSKAITALYSGGIEIDESL